MTVSYATALADETKKPVWILEFPDHSSQRYVSSPMYENLSSAANPGLVVRDALSTELNLRTGEIDFGEVECLLVDEDGGVATFLGTNDSTLRAANVTLKYGFDDVTEANFQSIGLLFDDWGREEDGFVVRLRSALAFLDNPLFEDFQDDSFTLTADLATATTTTFTVKGDLDSAGWRSSGHVLLTDQQTQEAELIQYSAFAVVSQDQSRVTITSRRKFNVGAVGKHWAASRTQVRQAWVYEEDPVDLFLRLATTTSGGANGSWDEGDGDGLGDMVPVALIDTAAFTAIRDERLLDEDGNVRNGIYNGVAAIDSLLDLFRQEFLACGVRLGLTTAGKVTLRRYPAFSTSPTVITGKVVLDSVPEFDRGYPEAENNVRWSHGWSPGDDKFFTNIEKAHARSQTRYGKAKLMEVQSLGLYGSAARAFGYPDLGWDRFMERRASEYAMEFANPSEDIKVEGFLELQDTDVGTLVQLTHPGIYDLDAGAMGVTDALFYVTSLERDPENGLVKLWLRLRLAVGRPLYWAPNAAPVYASAAAADKQYGYWSPNTGNFADGGAPYEWGT